MKNYDELIQRFDDIPQMPVSDEVIGAYLEGNLNLHEMEAVGDIIDGTPSLHSLVEDIAAEIVGFDEDDALMPFDHSNDGAMDDYSDGLLVASSDAPEIVDFDPDYAGDGFISGIAIDDTGIQYGMTYYDSGYSHDDLNFDLPDLPLL